MSEYYNGINNPEVNIQGYLCDRCNTQPITYYEYIDNINNGFHYCQECWNYIHLQTYIDKDGNYHSIRSERIINS